jgi:cyclopropane-fatty-acyl-phospholipid synthase
MAGSAAAFRRGDIGVYQVLLSKPDRGKSRLPLTREDLYTQRCVGQEVGLSEDGSTLSKTARPPTENRVANGGRNLPERVTFGDT